MTNMQRVTVSELLSQFWFTYLTSDEYSKLKTIEEVLAACEIRIVYLRKNSELYIKTIDYAHTSKASVEFGIKPKTEMDKND